MSTNDTLAAMRADEKKRMDAVPDQLVQILGERLYDDAHEGCDEDGCAGGGLPFYENYARFLLADVIDEHERMVRERVAEEIEAARPVPRGSALLDFVGAVMQRVADIARGGARW